MSASPGAIPRLLGGPKKKACVRESDTGAYVVRLAQRTPLTSPGLLQPEMDRDPITGAFVVCLSKHNPPVFSGDQNKKKVCVQESNTGAMLFVSPCALPGPLLGSCNPKGSGWSSTIHMCVDCRPTRRLPVAKVSRWIDRGRASRGGLGPETTIFSKETARAKQSRVVASSTRPVATTFLFYNTRRRFLTTGGTHTVC